MNETFLWIYLYLCICIYIYVYYIYTYIYVCIYILYIYNITFPPTRYTRNSNLCYNALPNHGKILSTRNPTLSKIGREENLLPKNITSSKSLWQMCYVFFSHCLPLLEAYSSGQLLKKETESVSFFNSDAATSLSRSGEEEYETEIKTINKVFHCLY